MWTHSISNELDKYDLVWKWQTEPNFSKLLLKLFCCNNDLLQFKEQVSLVL